MLKGLALSDRIGCLIVNLSSQNKDDAVETIKSLISAAAILGQNLPDEFDRLRCATAIREAATKVEAEHQPLVRK